MGKCWNESKIFFWLHLSGLSVRRQTALLYRYKNDVLKLVSALKSDERAIVELVGEQVYKTLVRTADLNYIELELNKLKIRGINVVTACNPLYPESLRQSEVGAPYALFYRGDLACLDQTAVAVVGTRGCSAAGKDIAAGIGEALANAGVTLVSGMAAGIDSAALLAAAEAKGKTIAVLGSGIENISPTYNYKILDKLVQSGGLVLSEYRPDAPATKYSYPERNRIISGLSSAVVVVEAPDKSGALITASFALEQGREVFVVPGGVKDAKYTGSNKLLFDGATPVRDGADVLFRLGIESENTQAQIKFTLDKEEEILYSLICSGVSHADALIEKSGLPPAAAIAVLAELEMKSAVKKVGESYCKME